VKTKQRQFITDMATGIFGMLFMGAIIVLLTITWHMPPDPSSSYGFGPCVKQIGPRWLAFIAPAGLFRLSVYVTVSTMWTHHNES